MCDKLDFSPQFSLWRKKKKLPMEVDSMNELSEKVSAETKFCNYWSYERDEWESWEAYLNLNKKKNWHRESREKPFEENWKFNQKMSTKKEEKSKKWFNPL